MWVSKNQKIQINNCKQQKQSSQYYMVQSTIGKTFLKLIKKHFPWDHKLHKIFNRNTLKLSYSCMSSMSSVIKQCNYKVLSTTKSVDRSCNCRNKDNCPFDGKCL